MTASYRCLALIAAIALAPAASAADFRVTGKLISDRASGPPIQVASQDRVSNLNADLLDGRSAAAFQESFRETIVISPTGDPVINGATLANTVNGITGASQSEPVLVWIEPGTYTLGQTLSVPANVYLRGSGQGATRITRTGDLETTSLTVVALNGTGGLSRLTVLGFAGGSDRIRGVDFDGAGTARLQHVTVEVRNAPTISYAVEGGSSSTSRLVVEDAEILAHGGGFVHGVRTFSSTALDVHNSTITAQNGSSATGVYARGAEATLTDSKITSDDDGVYSDDGLLTVRNCDIFGQSTGASGNLEILHSRVEGVDSRAISTVSEVPAPTIVHSQVIGTVLAGNCAAVTDGSFNFHASSCP